MMTTPALWVAFAAMLPLMLIAAWGDLKHLKIPNWIPLTVLGIYIITGLWGLPFDRFLWGLGAGGVALVAFFLVWAAIDSFAPGSLGAGDVKLLAALVPFVDRVDAFSTLFLWTIVILVCTFGFIIAWAFTRKRTGLVSLDQSGKKVARLPSPFGVALAVTAIIHLGQKVQDSLV